MGGVVHSIATKRVFDFSNIVAGAGSFIDVPLVRAMEISEAKAFDVVVRVHAINIGANASIEVKVRPISLTNEEPQTDFTNATDLVSVTLDNATSATGAPLLVLGTAVASASVVFGNMIRIFIRATQAAAGAATITATLSIDLVVRDN